MTGFDFGAVFLDAQSRKKTTALIAVYKNGHEKDLKDLTAAQKAWLEVKKFTGAAGQCELMSDEAGKLDLVVFGLGESDDQDAVNQIGLLASKLPAGGYHLQGPLETSFEAVLAFGLGAYKFNRYKSESGAKGVLLKLNKSIDVVGLTNQLKAVYLGRDLINIPANDLGPELFEKEIKKIALAQKAEIKVIKGKDLLSKNFPMIHAVGRAAKEAPRLVELQWGKKSDPAITLVGKGICFDTGGLNLKPGNAMSLMKKDMGGAATSLTLASLIMSSKLRVKLRVLLPIAENSVSGDAFRPGDVLSSRKGFSVEIGNTDAEGRLVLADALTLADEESPQAIFCFATLTGSARVGLGPDLPPFYTDDETVAEGLEESAVATNDYMWRLPFWDPYDKWLSSKIADVNHISDGAFAGSITAALFLRRFVENAAQFVHFDIYGWTPKAHPTKPIGGEPQTARAVFNYLTKIYG